MWWSRALVCLMVLALGPAGCGFQPIYAKPRSAPSSAMAEQLAAVRVAGIEDRLGQQVRNSLVENLSPRGEPAAPRYVLKIQLRESLEGLASARDGNSTIGRNTLTAQYTLTDSGRDVVVYAGETRSMASYRYLGPRYASTASEREAQSAAATEVAYSIRSALIAYFSAPETFQQRQSPTRSFREPEQEDQ